MSGPMRGDTVVRLDGRAAPRSLTLTALARGATPHADGRRAVRRMGRLAAAGTDEARVAGLSPFLAPGDVVVIGDGDPAFAAVSRVDRAVAVVALDRPGARPDDTVEIAAPPPRIGDAWLGRAVDALGRPLDGAPVPMPGPRPEEPAARPDPAVPVVTGVGALDALAPVLPGEAWAVRGPAGSGRTVLLRMIAEEGAWDAVVVCALAPRARERTRWLEPAPNRLVVTTGTGAGPAECAAALALAAAAARDLAALHPRVAVLVDGAEHLPDAASPARTFAGLTAFVACRDGAPSPASGFEGALVLDAALAARGHHPAVDIAATLAASPPPPGGEGATRALRALASLGDGKEGLMRLREALAQSPRSADPEAPPDPGAILTRAALAELVRGAEA